VAVLFAVELAAALDLVERVQLVDVREVGHALGPGQVHVGGVVGVEVEVAAQRLFAGEHAVQPLGRAVDALQVGPIDLIRRFAAFWVLAVPVLDLDEAVVKLGQGSGQGVLPAEQGLFLGHDAARVGIGVGQALRSIHDGIQQEMRSMGVVQPLAVGRDGLLRRVDEVLDQRLRVERPLRMLGPLDFHHRS
jgi:hypothetical protein